MPSAAGRIRRSVPGVRKRHGDRGPPALTSAARSLAQRSDFGLQRRSVSLVLPSASLWVRKLTSRSSGRVQRQRSASPSRHRAAPLNSRSVRRHMSRLGRIKLLVLGATVVGWLSFVGLVYRQLVVEAAAAAPGSIEQYARTPDFQFLNLILGHGPALLVLLAILVSVELVLFRLWARRGVPA